MSDEIRPEDEVEAHGSFVEGGLVEGASLKVRRLRRRMTSPTSRLTGQSAWVPSGWGRP